MFKKLLTLAALMLPLGMSAQSVKAPSMNGMVSKQVVNVETPKAMAPQKADLAANQRLVGWYDTDDYTTDGLGLPKFPGTWKAATWMSADVLSDYVGAKVVGIRFALATPWSNKGSRVFMAPVDAEGGIGADVVSKDLSSVAAGWNTVMLDAPYTLPENPSFIVGFDYVQESSKYPLSVIKKGDVYKDLYIFANIPQSSGGSGEGWYNMGNDYGNLSVQLIVEIENLPAKQIIIKSIKSANTVAVNTGMTCEVSYKNYGLEAVNSYKIDLQIDGNTVDSYTGTNLAVNANQSITSTFTLPSEVTVGSHTLTAKLSELEGAAPQYPSSVEKTINVVSKAFPRAALVEEFTGTACGYCPRGIAGMAKMRDRFGDKFVGIALHQYNSTDPMYFSLYYKHNWPVAPSSTINRNGKFIDPFYGEGNDVCNDVEAAIAELPALGITVTGEFNEDSTKVNAKATVESLINADNYSIVFVLIADDVKGNTSAWKQSNYYTQYTASELGNDPYLSQFCSGGTYGQSSFFWAFDDVAIASSYTSQTANAATLGTLTADQTTTSTYTLNMPTKAALKAGLNMNEIAVCAFVLNAEGGVENAAKYYLKKNTSGINDLTNDGKDAKEVARFTADGRQISAPQKGINIVKMSDGTTKKVVIK